MKTRFHLDSLDQRILKMLTQNARVPYLEIARACKVELTFTSLCEGTPRSNSSKVFHTRLQ